MIRNSENLHNVPDEPHLRKQSIREVSDIPTKSQCRSRSARSRSLSVCVCVSFALRERGGEHVQGNDTQI